MEVGRQLIFWFIICCCANIIYTQELADITSTTPSSDESSDESELETGNLNAKITAHKNGTKVKLTLAGNVLWKNDKSKDNMTCAVPTVTVKGERGDRGFLGFPGLTGEKGEKGDRGTNGDQGAEGKMGIQGDKGDNGNKGAKGEMGDKGSTGEIGLKGEKGECKKDDANLNEIDPKFYGQQTNPAYSCSAFSDGTIYVNRANGFQVDCKEHTACVRDLPKDFNFNDLKKNEAVSLLSNTKLNKFYRLSIPNISYLMSTNSGFSLTLIYNDEVEILEILSWNGIRNKISELKLNTGPQGCKANITPNPEGKTELKITCKPALYLPMDFYIKAKKETVSINLNKLCFN